ncbi:hypothetical protein FRB90_007873 [Tulasnella sp. 427]|nr:hypothetical protein FRB90_007873 [Tulasnella sp. 427]
MAVPRRAPLSLDTYDPFAASSSSSFLPPMGLFSPVEPSPAARPATQYCATIPEEEDNEEANEESYSSSSSTITPFSVPDPQRRTTTFAIHPRMLRSDSCSSDEDSDIPPVLRFPVPPSTIPTNRSPRAALKPVTIPPPQLELKSCFEDDDDDDEIPAPSSRRSSPTQLSTPISARPSSQAPNKPFALLKKATNALKSSSPPRSVSSPKTSPVDKPLPKVPQPHRPRITPAPYEESQQPISSSPTPSLSSSSTSSHSESSPSPMGYIPVGSIIPAPAIVQDLDEYLETLEMYFPSELWEDHPHELRRKPNAISTKSRASPHRKRPSASSSESSSESSSSCSRSSSDENLRRKSSFDDAVIVDPAHPLVHVQKLLKNSASSGDLIKFTSTSSTSVRVSSPLSPPPTHSRSGSSSSAVDSSATVTPGSRTPSPTHHLAAPMSPKSILKTSRSSPMLRDAAAPMLRSSSRSSNYTNVPMSPTRGRAPMAIQQLFSR